MGPPAPSHSCLRSLRTTLSLTVSWFIVFFGVSVSFCFYRVITIIVYLQRLLRCSQRIFRFSEGLPRAGWLQPKLGKRASSSCCCSFSRALSDLPSCFNAKIKQGLEGVWGLAPILDSSICFYFLFLLDRFAPLGSLRFRCRWLGCASCSFR